MSTHLPLHSMLPPLQYSPQFPFWHTSPVGQALEQEPQWLALLLVSMQVPLQLAVPGGHTRLQLPFTQTWPALQTLPHWPQLDGSVATVTHS